MNFREVIRMALRALARNKMRTMLTMLGIIIGVGAVICTVAIGQGAGQASPGANSKPGREYGYGSYAGSVNTGGVRMGSQATKTLTIDDAQAILQARCQHRCRLAWRCQRPCKSSTANQNWSTRVHRRFRRISLTCAAGRWSKAAISRSAMSTTPPTSALSGTPWRMQLFGDDDPVGKTIRVAESSLSRFGVARHEGPEFVRAGSGRHGFHALHHRTEKNFAGISWLQMISAGIDSEDGYSPPPRSKSPLCCASGITCAPTRTTTSSFAARTNWRRPPTKTSHILTLVAGEHRLGFAAGRRHRNHEHHAGFGHRTHARNRRAHGCRRHRTGRAAPIFERSAGA